MLGIYPYPNPKIIKINIITKSGHVGTKLIGGGAGMLVQKSYTKTGPSLCIAARVTAKKMHFLRLQNANKNL